ncbi:MAG: nitrile hydratase accessory protein [Acidimicrobiales bacterium]
MTEGAAGRDPLDVDGPAAPPRANGELVFTAPWQSRLFATTMRLHETQRLEWETFRQGLIDQIAIHEGTLDDSADYDYWGCWQRALEQLLDELQVVSRSEIEATTEELAARPPGHDHDHADHDHGDHDHHDHGDHDHHRH